MTGPKAFESPLISHARMRALYRGLVVTRVLGGKVQAWPRRMEACWVGTAVDLKDGDLTNDSGAEWLIAYVRALGLRKTERATTNAEIKRVRKNAAEAKEFGGSAADRLLCAVGQAMALKASGHGVVVAYVEAGAMKRAKWRRVLGAANGGELPLVVVATPGRETARFEGLKVPVIPVDAGDVVAIYRVAQESIGRARADGKMVVIECVDCGVDPVKLMAAQLVKKGICTSRWVVGVEASFRKVLGSA